MTAGNFSLVVAWWLGGGGGEGDGGGGVGTSNKEGGPPLEFVQWEF